MVVMMAVVPVVAVVVLTLGMILCVRIDGFSCFMERRNGLTDRRADIRKGNLQMKVCWSTSSEFFILQMMGGQCEDLDDDAERHSSKPVDNETSRE